MIVLNVKETTLTQMLEEIQTDSKLEEMLSLMSNDRTILEMSVGGGQLYKEIKTNEDAEPSLVSIPHWVMTEQELAQFCYSIKDIVGEKLNRDLVNDHYMQINLRDARFLLLEPPASKMYAMTCRKILPVS